MPESVTLTVGGRTMVIETGELAKQANGSALVRYGDQNVVLCAVTASEKPREGIDFFPLTCDFEEKMYAAGKIPGGYIKREGRPTEHGVLSSRQIDRPIRPLFPDGFRNDVQIVATVLSIDPRARCRRARRLRRGRRARAVATFRSRRRSPPCASAATKTASSSAIRRSPQYETGGMDIVIAGTADAVMMVEGGGNEIAEEDFLGAVEFAHAEIKQDRQSDRSAGEKERQEQSASTRVAQVDADLEHWVRKTFAKDVAKAMRIVDKGKREAAFASSASTKRSRAAARKTKTSSALLETPATAKEFHKILKAMEEDELRTMVVDEKIRPDGRKPNEIRPIWCKVHYVPRVHGSRRLHARTDAGLHRGDARIEERRATARRHHRDLEDKRYMHFYNFPPFSVGETRPMRGPGRREIGHGHLAERALLPVLPPKDEFPYTHAPDERSARIQRLVVDGVGLRFVARADGCGRADQGARRRRRDGPDSQRQ